MIICTICARGGSKGVKNKNIRKIKGKPLISYTIQQALKSELFEVVAVSSDSDEVLEIAKKFGATHIIKRPEYLATDTSAKIPVIKHAMEQVESNLGVRTEILVDLDCTSPLRNIEDIKKSVELLIKTQAPNVVTGTPARRSPYFNLVELQNDETVQLAKKLESGVIRRQDAPRCFDMNASIYAWTREGLLNSQSALQPGTRLYIMPEERSLDIDSELDFQIVEFLMNQREDLV